MLTASHKKNIGSVTAYYSGFFGTPALFRATGAADHFAQVEQPGVCYFDLILSPSSYDRCLREHLGGKPYWDLRSRDEYQGTGLPRLLCLKTDCVGRLTSLHGVDSG